MELVYVGRSHQQQQLSAVSAVEWLVKYLAAPATVQRQSIATCLLPPVACHLLPATCYLPPALEPTDRSTWRGSVLINAARLNAMR